MRQPNPRNWSNENGAAPITADATPAAAVDMLVMADAYPVDVATTPYCGTGRLFKGCVDTTERYLAFMVAPGALNARAAFIRPEFNAGTDTGKNNTSWTGTGGTTPPDTIQTADPLATTDPSGAGGGVSWSYRYGWGVDAHHHRLARGRCADPSGGPPVHAGASGAPVRRDRVLHLHRIAGDLDFAAARRPRDALSGVCW